MQNGQEYNPYKIFVGIFIPNLIIQDQNLSPGAKITFGVLSQFSGKYGVCCPRQERIAERMGISKRQVIRYIEELKKEKYISVSQRGLRKSNIYKFLWKKVWAESVNQEVTDMSTPEVSDLSTPIRLNRFIVNRDPPISPLKGGAPKTSYLRKEKKVGREAESKEEDLGPKGKEILERINDEWKKVVRPKIIREVIKKREKDLNFKELAKLDQTRLNFIGEKIKEMRSGQCPGT